MGTQTVYRYRRIGVTADQFDNAVGTIPTVVGNVSPSAYQDLTYDSDYHTGGSIGGAVEQMAAMGWEFVTASPPAGTPLVIRQTVSAAIASDSSSIPVASGWTDVTGLSVSITTLGGSIARMAACAAPAAIAIGASYRVLINGGSFSDVVLGTMPLKLSVGLPRPFFVNQALGATSPTTYTFRVQAQGVGVLSSVSLEALVSSIAVTEYSA